MKTERKCRFCQKSIDPSRHGSARYCCKEHAYLARLQRNYILYHKNQEGILEIKRNEKTLSLLYWIKNHLKKEVTYADLEKVHFNFGISTDQMARNNNEIWTIIGSYGYYINPKSKIIELWERP